MNDLFVQGDELKDSILFENVAPLPSNENNNVGKFPSLAERSERKNIIFKSIYIFLLCKR